MKKILYLFLLLPVMAVAQKIQTKKDKVLFDEKEVAIMKEPSRDNYEFFSLDGKKQFTVKYNALAEGTTILYQWLTLTNADKSKTSEIEYEVLMNSLSASKIMIKLISSKYGLIDSNGIDPEKVAAFFAVERESLSEKHIKNVTIAKAQASELKAEYDAKIGRVRPFVKQDGTVVSGGPTGTSIIGKVIPISNYSFMGNNGPIVVYDLDRIAVARAQLVDNVDNDVNVTLFNDDKFTYRAKRRYTNTDNNLFLTGLIEELVARDYTLGHQAETYNANLRKEKINRAKERSVNVYNAKGFVVDEKGVKMEGIITCAFQKLDVDETGDIAVVDMIDNYGKKVSIKYLNEKGKERTKTLSASDEVHFCAAGKNGTECYYGMKVKGDSAKKLSNAMSLGFNNAYFYRLLFEENGNQVLVDPLESDRFVIKLKDKKEGQMIDSRNNTKMSAELAEYLSACPSLVSEIKKNAFDLKQEENLVTIVKEYNQCKKTGN